MVEQKTQGKCVMTKILLPTHDAWDDGGRRDTVVDRVNFRPLRLNDRKRQQHEKKHVKSQNDPPADATRAREII